MAIKKTVKRRSEIHSGFKLIPWIFFVTRKKIYDWAAFVKKQRTDLVRSFQFAKVSTKVVLVSAILFFAVFGFVSLAHSYISISEKRAELDEIERKIAAQQKANEELENELNGNLDALMEERAREHLEMVYPDEQIFINQAG